MELIKITDNIAYFPTAEEPLSANIGVVFDKDITWLFDVGNGRDIARAVNALPGKKRIVLSHFHPDHTGNIKEINRGAIYAGGFTAKKITYNDEEIRSKCVTVDKDMYFDTQSGEKIHVFPLPSSHAKGSLGLEYGGYIFTGDGTYTMRKNGDYGYNAGLLQELIALLKKLPGQTLLLSHREPFAQDKAAEIARLEEIYAKREKNNPFILTGWDE